MTKIDFEVETQYGVFKDAIVLPNDHGLSDAEIQAIKDSRVANWIEVIEAPPEEPEVIDVPAEETVEEGEE